MKNEKSPYGTFEGYFPLKQVIDTYMSIWYEDNQSDDNND